MPRSRSLREVNDPVGHAAGDKVPASRRLTRDGGAGRTAHDGAAGRGDEFAILMPGAHRIRPTAGRLAEKILEALRRDQDGSDVEDIPCSIGIAVCPDDSIDRQELLTHADTALYRAKTEGRATSRFFEAKMGIEVRDRRELEHDLRRYATARGELRLVYQPQRDLMTGWWAISKRCCDGSIRCAATSRLRPSSRSPKDRGDPRNRLLGPAEACREAASWRQPLTIAANVSAVQIHSTNLVQTVHQILLETGLPPGRLELEITETALVKDLNRADDVAPDQGIRHPHRHGRFRHRLFVAIQSARLSVRQDQD